MNTIQVLKHCKQLMLRSSLGRFSVTGVGVTRTLVLRCTCAPVAYSGKEWSGRNTSQPKTGEWNRRYATAPNYHVKSPLSDIKPVNQTIHECIYKATEKWPQYVSLECAVTGRQYTFRQVRELSHKVAAALQHRFGIQKGDHVAVVLPNMPEYAMVLLGSSEAGAITTLINPVYTPGEIRQQIEDAKVKLIYTTPTLYPKVMESLKLYKQNLPVIMVREKKDTEIPQEAVVVTFDEIINDHNTHVKPVRFEMNDTCLLPYSSGTTGVPKGVELSHANVVSNLHQNLHQDIRVISETKDNNQENILGVLPLYHIYGLNIVLLSSMATGAKYVSVPRFDPKTFVPDIVKHKISLLYIVPPLVLFLGGNPEVKPEHLSTVHLIVSGAAPLGEKDALRLQEKLKPGANVIQAHGLTETSPTLFIQRSSRYGKYASVGVPIPSTTVRVVDVETGKDQPVNKVGEIVVTGPQIMKGYYNKPESNKVIFDDKGWLRTGDLGYYDHEGDFYVVDRLKELIKVKGFQVAPAELEELLRSHPKIADAAVIGIADPKHGEVPRGFVVVKKGQNLTEDEVKDFISSQVAKFKQLAGGVEFIDIIPKSAAGKILRKELRAKCNKQ